MLPINNKLFLVVDGSFETLAFLVGLNETKSTVSSMLFHIVKDVLVQLNNCMTKLRRCDGASSMAGSRNGTDCSDIE